MTSIPSFRWSRRRPPPGRAPLAAAFVVLALAVAPALASQLVPQNLARMIEKSDVIVTGEVLELTDGIENGLPYTQVTLSVKGSIKRNLALDSQYTFRQYGLLKPRKLASGHYLLPSTFEGMPTWVRGERVTVFMNGPVGTHQMRTPVGLAQGKFTYSGSKTANSYGNRDLFTGMSVKAGILTPTEADMLRTSRGPVEAGVLLGLVRRAVDGDWIAKGWMQ
ncbi:MAG: hypothetical protein JSR18_13880 [Proteobacteria bacterium]|nr:hypothetical protein [Pseudomonadota bacterium]